MNLSSYDVTLEEAIAMNNSPMGLAGYEIVYQDNVPYADFCSVEDKKGKKLLSNVSSFVNIKTADPTGGEEKVVVSSELYGTALECVGKHYKAAVGIGYGICSKLIFEAVENLDGKEDLQTELINASLLAWRVFYEGFGLSGYSPMAARVFNILDKGSVDTQKFQCYWDAETKEADVRFNHDAKDLTNAAVVLNQQTELSKYAHLGVQPLYHIVTSRSTTRTIGKLEGFGEMKEWWEPLKNSAIKYGALRRFSQGDDRVDEVLTQKREAEMIAMDENIGLPMAVYMFENLGNSIVFNNKQLGDLAASLSEMFTIMFNHKQNLKEQEEQNVFGSII